MRQPVSCIRCKFNAIGVAGIKMKESRCSRAAFASLLHQGAENNAESFDVFFTCGFAQVPNTIRPVTSKGVPRGHML
jgi:hypothetical protein